jgi:hypothetical protein
MADPPAIYTVPFGNAPCPCQRWHRPQPLTSEMHHVWPLGDGGPTGGEKVPLCPTCHDEVHVHLRRWGESAPPRVRPPGTNRWAWKVAVEGWRRAHGFPASLLAP